MPKRYLPTLSSLFRRYTNLPLFDIHLNPPRTEACVMFGIHFSADGSRANLLPDHSGFRAARKQLCYMQQRGKSLENILQKLAREPSAEKWMPNMAQASVLGGSRCMSNKGRLVYLLNREDNVGRYISTLLGQRLVSCLASIFRQMALAPIFEGYFLGFFLSAAYNTVASLTALFSASFVFL